MKTVVALSFVAFQLLSGCKNTAVTVGEHMPLGQQDVVMEEEDASEKPEQNTISLKEIIGNKNYAILEQTDSMEISNIQSVLIEGTNDEYGRKLEIIKQLQKMDGKLLNSILNNNNYIEVSDGTFTFNPTLQFQLKHGGEQLLLLLDEKTGSLGFTSVEGQTILKIAEPLTQELIVISNN